MRFIQVLGKVYLTKVWEASDRPQRPTLQSYPLPVGRVKNDSGNQPESAPQPVYLY
jgi:hypothetical protein